MKKLLLLFVLISGFATSSFAQETATLAELKSMKADKEAVAAGIQGEIDALAKRILEYPGWTTGAGVLFGLNFGGLNKWYNVPANPDQQTQLLSIGLNAFANYNADKYYWRNGLGIAWSRGSSTFAGIEQASVEVGSWNLTSLGGYYLWSDKLAVSARVNWQTVLFDLTPGSVTASAGLSYTPIKNLEFWVHPLGYQWNYPSEDFTSTPGASFGGSYTGQLFKGISWTSTLAGFYSYVDDADNGFTSQDLFNWRWVNGFVIDNLWNGIGVGLTVDLIQNKQLAKAAGVVDSADFGVIQSLYNLGFTYSISR